MKRRNRTMWSFFACLAALFYADLACAMQAGAAKTQIELPAEVPLAGHAYRQGRSAQVVHDSIYARCLYLEEDQFEIALVTLDLWGITPELRTRILELAPAELDPGDIIIAATGTHNGPGGFAQAWELRQVYGRYMPDVLESIAQSAAAAMDAAINSRTRATIGYRIGEQQALSQNAESPDGPRDNQIGVIRVDDSDGNPITIIGALSARAATLERDVGLAVSADFPGVFCKELEALSASETVAIFLSGATGDQTCAPREGLQSLELTEYVGSELAILVKGIANTIKCDELPISTNFMNVRLPRTETEPHQAGSVMVQTIEIGRLFVPFIPGAADIAIKNVISDDARRRGYDGVIAVGLTNDNIELSDESNAQLVLTSINALMRRGDR